MNAPSGEHIDLVVCAWLEGIKGVEQQRDEAEARRYATVVRLVRAQNSPLGVRRST